jgi:hypothetical protein
MRPVLTILLAGLLALPVRADDKKAFPAPSQEQQVLALVNQVQNDLKADKRAAAAEVLHNFDGAQFPEIAPVLIQVLERDSDPNVRKEAAKSLGKIKPTCPETLDALNRAAEKDPVLKVRMAARMAKLGYKAPPPAPTQPLPAAPHDRWSDKLIFWKKKPTMAAPPPESAPPILKKPQGQGSLPKPPPGEDGPLLLPPPNSGNPK